MARFCVKCVCASGSITGGMKHAGNYHCFLGFQYLVDDAVWKTFGITPADVLNRVSSAIQKWVLRKSLPNSDDFLDKFRSKPRLAAFVPRGCVRHVLLDLRAELAFPNHFEKRERRRAFVSSSGTAEPGLR